MSTRAAAPDGRTKPLLAVEHVHKAYSARAQSWFRPRTDATRPVLADVSLQIAAGQRLGIVGESGSGKTTLARCLVGLVKLDSGAIWFDGEDISKLKRSQLTRVRRRLQMVYQDPYSSLNPAKRIGASIVEAAIFHGICSPAQADDYAASLLSEVGLNPSLAPRKPGALSGGERQRVAIARALALRPEVLIADEAVSALDVSVQAQILRLLANLSDSRGLTLIFISHQLATVAQLTDQIAVMYHGEIAETGATREVFASPGHPHTIALLEADLSRETATLSLDRHPPRPAAPASAR